MSEFRFDLGGQDLVADPDGGSHLVPDFRRAKETETIGGSIFPTLPYGLRLSWWSLRQSLPG
ncbi:hypothetical protein ACC735_39715, partial [Rhizobium ruizarguesonis]